MFYGDSFKVECPTGSGDYMHLGHVAEEIQHRLQHIFARDDDGRRACNGGNELLNNDPHWRDYVFFHEFFHGDDGSGLGASHQTGWTGLIAKLINDTGVNCRLPHTPRTPSVAADHYFDDVFSRTRKPRPYISRRASTRSMDLRSDWAEDDEVDEDRKAKEKDDEEVLEYVNHRLKRMSVDQSAFGDEELEDEFESRLDH